MEPIIKMRLETLQADLKKIKCILKSVQERQAEISKLSEKLTEAQNDLYTVGFNIVSVLNAAENPYSPKPMDPSIKYLLGIAKDATDKLKKELSDALTNLKAVQTRWTPIESSFERSFEEDLNDRMAPWFQTIAENLEALNNGPGVSDQLLEKAWQDLGIITSQENKLLIFSEYVEFLGGLALRDAGLDEGICRIADELMRSFGPVGRTHWAALTIPASQEAETWARSIRMRFPEWTIWAVPLTAHELGKVVIDGSDRLKGYVAEQFPGVTKKSKKSQQQLRIYLADAFATYVMGPAYACSVILLRFDPSRAYDEKDMYPPDALRAHVVMSMLTRMFEKDRNVNPPYSEVMTKLKAAWQAALAQAKGQPPENLSEEEKRVKGWTDYLFKELIGNYARGLYQGKLWHSTAKALELLLQEEEAKGQLEGHEDWRDVLNAAWLCRINNVDASQKISLKAEELWQLIEAKRKETPERPVQRYGYSGSVVPTIPGGRK